MKTKRSSYKKTSIKALTLTEKQNSEKDSLLEMKNDINTLMNYFILPCDNLEGAFQSKEAIVQIEMYVKKHERLLYSEITNYVIKLLQSKQSTIVDNLIINLDNLFHYCMIPENFVCTQTKKLF